MRLLLLYFLCPLTLAGCYAGIHGNSTPLNAADLSVPHVYRTPSKSRYAQSSHHYWWNQFKDPQLNQLIDAAIAQSPNMQIAENRVRLAEHLAAGASASLWPTVDASGYLQRQKFATDGLIPPPFNGKTFNIGEVGFNFSYEFDFWGKNREALKSQISAAAAARADLAEAQIVLSSTIVNVYFEIQAIEAQLKVAERTTRQLNEIANIIDARARYGIESDIPVKTTLADAQSAAITVQQLKQARLLAKHQLAALIGNNALMTNISIQSFSYHRYHILLPAQIPAHVLALRPDVVAARLRAEAAAHTINVAKAGFFPDINLNGLFSYQSAKIGDLFQVDNQNNAITGAFDLPIFEGGALRANLGAKYAEYDFAVNQYNQAILTALHEVADQETLINNLDSQLRIQNAVVTATAHKYQLTQAEYHHGIVDYSRVLNLRNALLQQQMILIDIQGRQLQATAALITALGLGV